MNRWHKGLIERLEANGKELVWYVGRLADDQIHALPEPNAWNIHQVLCHVRDTERQVFLSRAQRILKEDAPQVVAFDQHAWMDQHYWPAEPLKTVLSQFKSARRRLIALLVKTNDKQWARYAIHPELGNISLEWLVTHCYNHTMEHIAQVGYAYEHSLLPKKP